VLIVNTTRVPPEQLPSSILALADPRYRGQCGIAKPLFGTTASHVACLWAHQGPTPAKALLTQFKMNDVQILAGNKTCAEMVGAGRLAFALTDTDDAMIEADAGKPVAIVFPDGGPRDMGTLVLPNTLALIKDCPHPQAGVKLIDYLLSPAVEARLAEGPSAQIPLNKQTTARSRAAALDQLKPMTVDFAKAAAAFEQAAQFVETKFLAP
jgi:iron(III) transport system substrate-binding protein